jgi:hypothetical protein
MSGSWNREEVEATVADYLHMLTMELTGQQFNKAEHRRKLIRLLNNRTEGAIERKHQNISSILIEFGCPYISGYKPLGNYQALLYEVVEDRLKSSDLFDRAALAAVQMPAAAPTLGDFTNVEVDAPKLTYVARESDTPKARIATKRDYIDREARNASLGKAGEEFVVDFERWRLKHAGYGKLAKQIEHVAHTRGDGLGYDVLSFDTTGRERLIEVKTTSFGKETPFFITRNEVDFSRTEAQRFHLYRLFDFRKEPRLFSFRGDVKSHCHLDPITYRARFT